MFGTSGKGHAGVAAQFAEWPKKFQAQNSIARLDFDVDLGGADNDFGLTWRTLPGAFDADSFRSNLEFQSVDLSGLGFGVDPEIVVNHKQMCLATAGTAFLLDGVLGAVPEQITDAHYGVHGGWMSSNQTIYLKNRNTSLLTLPTNLFGIRGLFEFNGFLFFTATQGESCVPVVGYVAPNVPGMATAFQDTNAASTYEYFTTQHIGEGGSFGVYKGKLVVATSRGVWFIVPGREGFTWVLGEQLDSWTLGTDALIAVGWSQIVALSGGDLYVLQEGNNRVYPETRFTSVSSTGANIVLGSSGDVAVSNGDGFECWGGFTAAGCGLLSGAGDWYIPDKVVRNTPVSLTLSTTTAHFPGRIGLLEINAHPSVSAVQVTTDFSSYALRQSPSHPNVWRAGISGQTMQIDFTVPSGSRITAPMLYFKPRSSL